MKIRNFVSLGILSVAALVLSSVASVAGPEKTPDPTGTWKFILINTETKVKSKNEHTLKLKLEDGKLTGTTDGFSEINGKRKVFNWPIKDAKLQGNQISFSVTHAPVVGTGPDSTTTYDGMITDNEIKGTSVLEFNGVTVNREFEAKRVKE